MQMLARINIWFEEDELRQRIAFLWISAASFTYVVGRLGNAIRTALM